MVELLVCLRGVTAFFLVMNGAKCPKVRPLSCATGIAWQPIRVEPIFAKTPKESEMTPPDSVQ